MCTALIEVGIIIWAIIDGKSHIVPGIEVQDNNRASTALKNFRRVCDEYGVPSRVRGDLGVENLRIAKFMEQVRGLNRASFIWGRCVQLVASGPADLAQESCF